MYLKELTVNGFKSFAKKSQLDFLTPITAVVGPNGSGKSNIAESFRFVLGEQSLKSLRGRAGEDLVWGGSSSISRGNRAAVKIAFNNQSRIFPLDFDEVTLQRTVYRDGQNEYRINDSVVRLRDIQELLAAANIGATGHHIISQGEADRILAANPSERRAMIEDALGLKIYQYKKAEAEKKLRKTEENIRQVELLRQERAPHLQHLKRQIQRMEKAVALRQELKNVYAEYLKREDIYLVFEAERINSDRVLPTEKLATLRRELDTAQSELAEKQTSVKDGFDLSAWERKLAVAKDLRNEAFKKVSQLEGQIVYLERKISQPVVSHPVTMLPLKDFENLVANIEKKVVTANQYTEVRLLFNLVNDILRSLHLFIKKTDPVLEQSSSEVEKHELANLQTELKAATANYQEKLTAEKVLSAEYESLTQKSIADVRADQDRERHVFALQTTIRETELQLERLENEMELINRDREEWQREVQEAVALLRADARAYQDYQILVNKEPVPDAIVATENREQQRQRRRYLEKLKIRLEENGVGADEAVEKEYREAVERDNFLTKEISDLETTAGKLEDLIVSLTEQLQVQFLEGINQISAEFSRFFVLMFGGGKASLQLTAPKIKKTAEDDAVDEEVKFSEGVELQVSLPNKRVKGLEMLSGGERALTSIALIFAMSQINPPPFLILDETDAALDEANSRRYGDLISALAKKTQLILITHNRETMSRAGVLYGVTMGNDGVSKLLSVKLTEAVQHAK